MLRHCHSRRQRCENVVKSLNSTTFLIYANQELIATERDEDEIRREIGADFLVYQDLDALIKDVSRLNPSIRNFETSCFDGHYITGDVTPEYLAVLEAQRTGGGLLSRNGSDTQLDLNLVSAE